MTVYNAKGTPINSDGSSYVQIIGPSGDIAEVNENGQLHIVAQGALCDNCSTTTALLAGETYTGSAVDKRDYNAIAVFSTSDVASATKGLEIQYSKDGLTNWRTAESYTIEAGAEKWFTPPAFGIYMRVVYTNGASDQTEFELSTYLHKIPIKWSSHNLQDDLSDQDDGTLSVVVPKLRTAANNYVSAAATANGNFKVSLEEFESDVSTNANTQLNVSPYILDEFGNYAHILGDNIFKGSIIAIEPEHHEIHCGDSYEATDNVTLGNGATRDYLIIVPNEGLSETYPGDAQGTKQYHLVGVIESESELQVEFYEASTATAGTTITSFNRNRNVSFTDFLAISYGPSITTIGTSIWGPWRVGSGRSTAGSARRTREFILKDNTQYILRITNQTTSNNNVNVEFDYYVHPGV